MTARRSWPAGPRTSSGASTACAPRNGLAEFDEIESPAFEDSPKLTVDGTLETDDVVVVTGTGRGHHREAGAFPFAYSDLFTFRGDVIAEIDSSSCLSADPREVATGVVGTRSVSVTRRGGRQPQARSCRCRIRRAA